MTYQCIVCGDHAENLYVRHGCEDRDACEYCANLTINLAEKTYNSYIVAKQSIMKMMREAAAQRRFALTKMPQIVSGPHFTTCPTRREQDVWIANKRLMYQREELYENIMQEARDELEREG